MATQGKKLRVKVATTLGGTYNTVLGVKSASMKRSGQIIDVTTLSDTELVKLMGMRDTSLSFSGNWEPDATGQAVIRTAFDNDTALFAQFLPDGGTTALAGRKFEVKVESYTEDGSKDDAVSVSFELAGSGAVTAV